jgi:hypothetical protein
MAAHLEIENIARRAAEPIELHYYQLVARPDEFEDRGEFVAAITALAADLLSTNDLTAGGPKARLLGGVVLVAGGYAGVTDLGHGRSFRNIWINPQGIV